MGPRLSVRTSSGERLSVAPGPESRVMMSSDLKACFSDSAEFRHQTRPIHRVFSVVFVPTLSCNCTCTHCFEKLTRECIDDVDFTRAFARIRDIAEYLSCKKLRIYWQGGEILCLRPESVQKAVDDAAEVFCGSGIEVEHHLQTNLLLYDSARWKSVVRNFHLGTISSSLDYPNLYRKTPTLTVHEYTGEWLRRKEEAEQDGFCVSVVSLPNPQTLELGAERFYHFFADEVRIKHVQVNLPFPGDSKGLQSLDLGQLTKFMTDLYRVWVSSNRKIHLSPLQAMEERIFHDRGVLPCCWGYNCANSLLAVGPNGDVGQCDCWITTFKGYSFGNLHQPPAELLNSRNRETFHERPLELMKHSKCGECRFWKMCFGGCPVRAMTLSGDIFSPDYYCPVYYDLFSLMWDSSGDALGATRG